MDDELGRQILAKLDQIFELLNAASRDARDARDASRDARLAAAARSRIYRAKQKALRHVTRHVTGRDEIPPHTPPLSLTEEPSGSSVRATRKRARVTWLDDWQPKQQHYEIAATERHVDAPTVDIWAETYRDWNRNAKGRAHSDPDAGFRNWIRRQTNGVSSNGKGRVHPLDDAAQRACDLADEWRRREQEYGEGLFGTPHHARSTGSR